MIPKQDNLWLSVFQPKPFARIQLVCFPYAGGGASLFRPWVRLLPAEIDVCAVQLPGRENRLAEPPFTRVQPLVEKAAQQLVPVLRPPFAFFGHSMGALLSFEMARHLRTVYGLSPLHLFVSGHRAPHVSAQHAHIFRLPDPEFIEEVRRLKGTPEEVLANAELLELLLPALRADFELCETYEYRQDTPLSCPISAFGGLQDENVGRDSVLAWRELTDGSFSARFFNGGHFFLHEERWSLLHVVSQTLLQYSLDTFVGNTKTGGVVYD
jgi:medium-chain acyl-[acyl-carrier-protein] hydrolase